MKKAFLLILSAFTVLFAFTQNHETHFCGQVAAQKKLFKQHPGAEVESLLANEALERFTQENASNRGGSVIIYTIPVVFHVIHQGGEENISDAQILDAVNVLNNDYRKFNADSVDIVEVFQDIASDCAIEFKLATIDPSGNCHSGINRISSPLTYDGGNSDMKALSYWPRNSYLNVWICAEIGDNVAGFTNLPGDVAPAWAAPEDGIVLRSNYTGSIGTSSYSKSRTLTHEIGHWLNLYHTWGPTNSPGDAGNCDYDDLVSDTPNTIGYTSCNLIGASCGSDLDNVQNYMEYSYCSRMFTWGQRQRMRSALTSNTAQRNQLWTAANLLETGVSNPPLCAALFTSPRNSACVGDSIYFTDLSYNGVLSWSWDFGDNTTLVGNDPLIHKNPVHQYTEAGAYNVSLEVSNGADEVSVLVNSFVTIFDTAQIAQPFEEGFEGVWPGTNWVGYNPNSDETWEITPSASFSGDRSLKLRNYSIDSGFTDELYTATFDMTGADTIFLSYKWAYANRVSETDDRFRISASGDCGNTWVVRKLRKGLTNLPTADATNSQFTPTSQDEWDGETIEFINPLWNNDRFRIKFDFNSLGGNNFYLDDINIFASGITGIYEPKVLFVYNIYPNPSEGAMVLDMLQTSNEMMSIELYNITGQLCQNIHSGIMTGGRHLIEIPEQPSGIYNVVLKKDGHVSVQKIIFQ